MITVVFIYGSRRSAAGFRTLRTCRRQPNSLREVSIGLCTSQDKGRWIAKALRVAEWLVLFEAPVPAFWNDEAKP